MKIKSLKTFLFETFNTEYTEKNDNFDNSENKHYDKSVSNKETGAHGFVKHKEDEPFTVEKHPLYATAHDDYFEYIKYVSDNKLAQKNPYFPRVYMVKKYMDKEHGTYQYKIDIEKLIPYAQISGKHLLSLLHRIIHVDDLNPFDKDKLSKLTNNITSNGKNEIMGIIGKNIERAFYSSKEIDIIKDPTLVDAIKSLRQAKSHVEKIEGESGVIYDLYYNNFMFRTGPYGYQMVFVDPFG